MTDASNSAEYGLKVAAKGLFFNKGEVLIVADPDKKWDFPGGGIEPGEKMEDGLRREVREELGFEDFTPGKPFFADEWFIAKKGLHVIGVFYRVELESRPDFRLSDEHSNTAWVNPDHITDYDVTNDTVNALRALGNGSG